MSATGSQDDHEVRCSQCRMKIQQRDGDHPVIRNAILRVDLNTAQSYAKCPRCKTWNLVALHYTRLAVGEEFRDCQNPSDDEGHKSQSKTRTEGVGGSSRHLGSCISRSPGRGRG